MYWVTLVCVGGYVVIVACCRFCSPSVSVCFTQLHCSRMCFVMGVPLLFTSLQLSGSDVIMWFSVSWPISRASISRGMSSVVDGFCTRVCVGAGCEDC